MNLAYEWTIRCGQSVNPGILRDSRLVDAYFREVYHLFQKRLSKLKKKEKMTEGDAESIRQIFNVLLEAKRLVDNEQVVGGRG